MNSKQEITDAILTRGCFQWLYTEVQLPEIGTGAEALGLLAGNNKGTCRELGPFEGLPEKLQFAERRRTDLVAGFMMQAQLNRLGCLRPRQGFSRVRFHEWSDL